MLKQKNRIYRKTAECMELWSAYAPCPDRMPDGIDIKMSGKKSPLGERMMVATFRQYFPVRESRMETTARSAKDAYITKKKAGETDEVPAYLPVITNKNTGMRWPSTVTAVHIYSCFRTVPD